MNTTILDKLYDKLTARERLPLIIAAARRADAVERQRLTSSAPRMQLTVGHHYTLGTALAEAADVHLLTLLDLAASYWQWWGLWGWQGQRRQSQTDREQGRAADAGEASAEDAEELRTYSMVRYQAFLFVTHLDGWRQFCRDWHIEPEALLDFKPGWDMVTRTEARGARASLPAGGCRDVPVGRDGPPGGAWRRGTAPARGPDGAITGRCLAYRHRLAGEIHTRTRQLRIGHNPALATVCLRVRPDKRIDIAWD